MDVVDIAGTALDERVAATCGALNRLYIELVDEIAELLRDNLWEIRGIRSPEHWVQWRTGLSGTHAAELVRVAKPVDGLPLCTQALRDGTMSIDQLDVVARNVPERYDADVVDIAQMSTVPPTQPGAVEDAVHRRTRHPTTGTGRRGTYQHRPPRPLPAARLRSR